MAIYIQASSSRGFTAMSLEYKCLETMNSKCKADTLSVVVVTSQVGLDNKGMLHFQRSVAEMVVVAEAEGDQHRLEVRIHMEALLVVPENVVQ